VGELPFHILMDEGLDGDTYVNLFDGGPTADGRVALLKTVARRRALQASLAQGTAAPATGTGWQLVANGRQADFRAMLLPANAGSALALPPATVDALHWQPGDALWGAALDTPSAEAAA
jgi:arginine N-succinyltransferase